MLHQGGNYVLFMFMSLAPSIEFVHKYTRNVSWKNETMSEAELDCKGITIMHKITL